MKIKIKILTSDNEIQNILKNVYDEMNKIDIPESNSVDIFQNLIFQSLNDVIEKMPEIIDEIYKDIQKEKNINDIKKHKINIKDDYKNNKDLTKDKSCCKNPCVDEFKDVLNIDHVI